MGALGIPGGVFSRAAALADGFGVDAVELLTGRAALTGRSPRAQVSAGGATHLLAAADGWWALTLSRADDIATVPALLQADAADADPWPAIARWSARRPVGDAVEWARLLGLPAARLGESTAAAPRIRAITPQSAPRPLAGLLVADLTSLWAGPLCGQLLARAGAVVVKVESPSRPDGTRAGEPAFFDWMNGGKLCYAVDFNDEPDRLADLLAAADVVLEGSRPAALARRGLGPCDVPARPGRVWLRITGYGTDGPAAERVAFGDDAAVAGGLVGTDGATPIFVGDAIADPLTGLTAADAVRGAVGRGGGELIEIALAEVAACYAGCPDTPDTPRTARPVRPHLRDRAAPLGADAAAVRRLVAERRGAPC